MEKTKFNPRGGVNLFVKYLDPSVCDYHLHKMFEPYGKIISAKVMMEGNRSRGFGFVCYETHSAARRAVTEMHGRLKGSKLLYVALAQNKEDREAYLKSVEAARCFKEPEGEAQAETTSCTGQVQIVQAGTSSSANQPEVGSTSSTFSSTTQKPNVRKIKVDASTQTSDTEESAEISHSFSEQCIDELGEWPLVSESARVRNRFQFKRK